MKGTARFWGRHEPGTARLMLVSVLLFGCVNVAQKNAGDPPATNPSVDSPDWWKTVTAPLGGEQIVSPDSFAVIVPRSDVDLESEMGQVPVSAGIASHFYFFRCPCGKVKLLGDFLARDYEADDVIDALRSGQFTVVSMSPILQNTRPSMLSIRFQAEGDGDDLVQTLRKALDVCARHSKNDADD
jgi:hypothetical protein